MRLEAIDDLMIILPRMYWVWTNIIKSLLNVWPLMFASQKTVYAALLLFNGNSYNKT